MNLDKELKEREKRIWDSLENMSKITLGYMEKTNPYTRYAWLQLHFKPAQWKKYVEQWEKAKDKLEKNIEEIQEYKKKDDHDLGELTELSYELRERKKDKDRVK